MKNLLNFLQKKAYFTQKTAILGIFLFYLIIFSSCSSDEKCDTTQALSLQFKLEKIDGQFRLVDYTEPKCRVVKREWDLTGKDLFESTEESPIFPHDSIGDYFVSLRINGGENELGEYITIDSTGNVLNDVEEETIIADSKYDENNKYEDNQEEKEASNDSTFPEPEISTSPLTSKPVVESKTPTPPLTSKPVVEPKAPTPMFTSKPAVEPKAPSPPLTSKPVVEPKAPTPIFTSKSIAKPEKYTIKFAIPNSVKVGEQFILMDNSTSTASVDSRVWSINGKTFTDKKFNYTFDKAGSYPVELCLDGTNNCQSKTIKVIAPSPPPRPETIAVSEEDDDFYCTSNNKEIGITYVSSCTDKKMVKNGSISLTTTKKIDLKKATVYASNNGKVKVSLSYKKGGNTIRQTVTKRVNKGSSQLLIKNLGITLKPGYTYTLSIMAQGDDLKLENLGSCVTPAEDNEDIKIKYNSNYLFFDLKYCH